MAVGNRALARERGGARSTPARGPRPRRQWKAYLYLAPALAVLGVFLLYPLGQSVWISFFDWNGLSLATWVGLDNYVDIATDPRIRAAFGHALVLIAFFALLPVLLGLLLTAVMGRAARLRGLAFFRAVLFLPQVVASVVVATSWLAIYAPDGLLNQVLRAVGLEVATRSWLGDFGTALPAVGLVGSWVGTGLCLVLFLSGAAQIDRELYEAARLEGAGLLREFLAVTLPGIRGQIAVALTLTVVAALKTFDLVYVTTRGGPGDSTTVPAYLAYERAFQTNQVGSACAIGIVLALLILLVSLVVARVQPAEED
ncbi:carbohydrate ABC transporter permease [Kineococcus sp. SYSU DK006]|uniref:carbohydrate ABC transporter permease n=1 Tax=Kineococcus sp. SYSU DK006 TaxID=3383127 RepID=UPI003D7C7456